MRNYRFETTVGREYAVDLSEANARECGPYCCVWEPTIRRDASANRQWKARIMDNRFKRVTLHASERADETWVNLDHVVAITPDPRKRFMTIVLDVFDASGWTWGPKTYRVTFDSALGLLDE